MKSRKALCLCTITVLIMVLAFLDIRYMDTRSHDRWQQDTIDQKFQASFSQLCTNLRETVSDEDACQVSKENLKYAYNCFSLFALTSHAENTKVNQIVAVLYELCETDELYTALDADTVAALNRLYLHWEDEELIDTVYKKIVTP